MGRLERLVETAGDVVDYAVTLPAVIRDDGIPQFLRGGLRELGEKVLELGFAPLFPIQGMNQGVRTAEPKVQEISGKTS